MNVHDCGPGSSVGIATKGWAVRDRMPVGKRFSARPDRTCGPPSLLYNGYRVFPGGRGGRGVGLTPHPIQCRGPRKSRAIPLLTLRAFVAHKKGETYPTYTIAIHVHYASHNFTERNSTFFFKKNRPQRNGESFSLTLLLS